LVVLPESVDRVQASRKSQSGAQSPAAHNEAVQRVGKTSDCVAAGGYVHDKDPVVNTPHRGISP